MLGSIDHVHIAAIIDALSRSDANALLDIVNELVIQSRNLETALDELAEAMHRIALIHAAPGFRDPERADWESLVERAAQISPEDAQLYYQIAITGSRDLGLAPDPRTGLEMTLLRMLAFRPTDAGSGGVVPETKSSAANTGAAGGSSSTNVQSGGYKTGNGGSEAAKAARAAFDAMRQAKPASNPKPASPVSAPAAEPEPATEPDPDGADRRRGAADGSAVLRGHHRVPALRRDVRGAPG